MFAGSRVPHVGKRRAAVEAMEKFGVHISPTTAQRAAMQLGKPPGKGVPPLIIPAEIEHRLESLCLALRELNLPIFRFMVMNYVNTIVAGTGIAEQLKCQEIRRHWYYNWLNRCQRLKTGNIRPKKKKNE